MTEQYRPDTSLAARETIRKQPQTILSEEFAERMNRLVGVMSDGQGLTTLFAPFDSRIRYRATEEGLAYSSPETEWVNFMDSLSHQESVQLRRLVRNAYCRFGIRTVGDMRDFTSEILSGSEYPNIISYRGRAFATLAFRSKEAENLTLGL